MRKILISIIAIAILITGLLSGCNIPTRDLNNFKVRLHSVNVHLFNRSYIEISFYLNISNYKGEYYGLHSLKYTIDGNSHYLCEGEIYSFSDGNTSLRSAYKQFEDAISLDGLTINSELNNALINKQPIRWLVSGELTLYDDYKLTGINSVIKIPFDGLTYKMTDYS
jgi:hypothetical protein